MQLQWLDPAKPLLACAEADVAYRLVVANCTRWAFRSKAARGRIRRTVRRQLRGYHPRRQPPARSGPADDRDEGLLQTELDQSW